MKPLLNKSQFSPLVRAVEEEKTKNLGIPGGVKAMHPPTQMESQVFPLVSRFQRVRWSGVRNAIHALPVCGEVILPRSKWNSITTSITRLQDAYEHTRRYRLESRETGVLVRRSL